MKGQFIFSTCNQAGLEVSALLRNSIRRFGDVPEAVRREGMTVGISVFENGERIFHESDFARVELGNEIEISGSTCSGLANGGAAHERLVVAECSLFGHDHRSFSQEHQLSYSNPRTGFFSTLLYDQRPVAASGAIFSPIILLAPKIWVSDRIRTLISFASCADSSDPGLESQPLEISILSMDGKTLASIVHTKIRNSSWILDVRAALKSRMAIDSDPKFFTVVARGGAGGYAIMTFVINESSGCFALEHSLPPQYYVDGDRKRIRDEGARFLTPAVC